MLTDNTSKQSFIELLFPGDVSSGFLSPFSGGVGFFRGLGFIASRVLESLRSEVDLCTDLLHRESRGLFRQNPVEGWRMGE